MANNIAKTPAATNDNPINPISIPAAEKTIPPGLRLKNAREAKGLSVDAVALQLHLSKKIIKNIEDNNYSSMARVYVRGYLRAYANLLEIPEEEILANLDQLQTSDSNNAGKIVDTANHLHLEPKRDNNTHHKHLKNHSKHLASFVTGLIILILIAFFIIYSWKKTADNNLNSILQSPTPAATSTPATPSQAALQTVESDSTANMETQNKELPSELHDSAN